MTADIARICETIARCRMLRDAGHVEVALRSEFKGRLRTVPVNALTARRRKLRKMLEESLLLTQLETLAPSAPAGASTAPSGGSGSATQAPPC